MNNLIVTTKSWNIKRAKNYPLITDRKDLTLENIKKTNPRYIFFTHWSWKIPKEIYENFECVVFHMTDLPYGRGGTPVQNLILRGFTKTKITAISPVDEIDAGPIYLKRDLSLEGTVAEIYDRASKTIYEDIIPYIIKNNPKPVEQKGKVTRFKRRKPKDSDISRLTNLKSVYDYIRMLDGEGYPPAFLETDNLRIEFTDAKQKGQCIESRVKIWEKY